MKRLSERHKSWLLRRAARQARTRLRRSGARKGQAARSAVPFSRDGTRPEVVQAWWGDRVEKLLAVNGKISPPYVLSFDENAGDTLAFLNKLTTSLAFRVDEDPRDGKRSWAFKAPGFGLRHAGPYFDFAQIQRIETAPAVVVAAEYDRARRLMDRTPPTVNLEKWSDSAFKALFELGFFEIVGLAVATEERYLDLKDGDTRLMRLTSGANADELRETCRSILDLSAFIDPEAPLSGEIETALNSALGEAIVNVSSHAYLDTIPREIRQVKRWWVAASANKSTRALNVVAYDQGASIPGTLPTRSWFKKVTDWATLRAAVEPFTKPFYRDPDYLEYAMQFGNSSTGQEGRGQGLPQMKEFIDICGAGKLDILSRHGRCSYTVENQFSRTYLDRPVDGTLVVWNMRLPDPNRDGE